jgi:ATP-dependent protease Clp ATPase subunit
MTTDGSATTVATVCSFCGISAAKTRVMVAMPNANICEECIRLAVEINEGKGIFIDQTRLAAAGEAATATQEPSERTFQLEAYRCSSCTKHRRQVRALMSGPNVHICDQCIEIAVGVCARAGYEI